MVYNNLAYYDIITTEIRSWTSCDFVILFDHMSVLCCTCNDVLICQLYH